MIDAEIFPERLCDGLIFLVLRWYHHSKFSEVVGYDSYVSGVTVVRLERQIVHTY